MKDFFSRHGGRLFRRRRRLFRLLLGGLRGGLLGLLGPGIGLLLLGMGPCGDELGRYVLVVAVEEGVLGGELLSLFLSELNSFLDLDPLCPPPLSLSLSPSLSLSLSHQKPRVRVMAPRLRFREVRAAGERDLVGVAHAHEPRGHLLLVARGEREARDCLQELALVGREDLGVEAF